MILEFEAIQKLAAIIVVLSQYYYDGCMLVKHRHLVDYSGYCVADIKTSSGATAYTVDYAKKSGTEVILIS